MRPSVFGSIPFWLRFYFHLDNTCEPNGQRFKSCTKTFLLYAGAYVSGLHL